MVAGAGSWGTEEERRINDDYHTISGRAWKSDAAVCIVSKAFEPWKKAKLDISWFEEEERQKNVYARRQLELNYFQNVEYEACTEEERKALTGGDGLAGKIKGKLFPGTRKIFRESEMYHPEIFDFEDKYMCGYFACEKYYADIMEILWKQFVFPESANPENKKMAEQIQSTESVSVHVRRGDYLDAENAAMFGNICTEEYYEGAIREMKQICPSVHFFIFSDDIPYVKKMYREKNLRW